MSSAHRYNQSALGKECLFILLFFTSLHLIVLPLLFRDKGIYSIYFGKTDKQLTEVIN